MNTSVPIFPKESYRDRYKRGHVVPHIQSFDEPVSKVNERLYAIKLRHRRAQAVHSYYDNNEFNNNEYISSKWTIVRQRLPDILALSKTYKPRNIQSQLILLVALMNKQSNKILDQSSQLNINEYNNTISHIVPSNVVLDTNGRSQLICLKRIPSEQLIHVDIDNLSFSIPTRQFILEISRGHAHETAARYCPPAISDMLIELSKTKIIDDRRQYKRAQIKRRLGRVLFLVVFIFMITMVFALIIGATKTIFTFDLFNDTFPYIPILSIGSSKKDGSFPSKILRKNEYWE